MSELTALEKQDECQQDEIQKLGSLNHSFIQAQLIGQLLKDERFTTLVELSLDINQTDLSQFGIKAKEELKPDVCIYPKKGVRFNKSRDVLRMPDMPLLAIEVLSPKQGIDDILTKFHAYFSLGVKSCWLVIPANESITVYSTPDDLKLFGRDDTEVVDEVADIHLPVQNVFGW
ncbi:MAG: Uma2 family endonuclease [Gammaproteobacteria bacterium]|nr:Uma2 family endonuclease [Gammaproteobacteria bacterium]